MLRACLGARLLPQSYQYPTLSEGDDRVGGQIRGDKDCPFSGVTKSGKVWRKVPESDARSVVQCMLGLVPHSRKGISVPATTSPEQCVVHVRYSSPFPQKGYRPPPIPLRSLFRLATSACIMWRKPNIPHCRHIWVVSATTRRELTLSLP